MNYYIDALSEYTRVSKRIDKATATKKDIEVLEYIIKRADKYSRNYEGSFDGKKWSALSELSRLAITEVKQVIALNRSVREIGRAARIA